MKSSYDILKEIESLIEQDSSDSAIEQEENEKEFLDVIDSDPRLTKQKDKSSNKKSKQQKLADKREKSKKQKAEDSPAEDDTSIVDLAKGEEGNDSKEKDKQPQKIKKEKCGDIQYHIDNYNELRSAPTLLDYKDEIKKYFTRLSTDEKVIAYVVNKAIVEITLNEISADKVLTPKSVLSLQGQSTSTQNKKPNVDLPKSEPQEDKTQSIDSPIVVGEGVKQDKNLLLSIVKKNK